MLPVILESCSSGNYILSLRAFHDFSKNITDLNVPVTSISVELNFRREF